MFDISLLYEIQKGNRDAFNNMFRHYYPKVMAYVVAIVQEEVAEDIVQDVFLYVWENREKLYAGAGFHSYLFQSAYTRCLDYFKKQHVIEKYAQYKESCLLDEYSNILKDETSVIEELYLKDFYNHLYDLLGQLPVQRREAFILTYIKGMKAKEVAELTGMPQRTVESHIYLTIKFLKEHMSKKDFYLLSVLVLSGKMYWGGFS
jgi:RNA polymerase sigma-70 factor, ECF subfamily